jgi:hypothetical protein
MRERAWAGALPWEWRPPLLIAEVSAARYVIRGERHEVLAWCEPRDVSGRRRCEIGSYATLSAAKAACERDAAARCRRDREERGLVDVRIAPPRRRRRALAAVSGG